MYNVAWYTHRIRLASKSRYACSQSMQAAARGVGWMNVRVTAQRRVTHGKWAVTYTD